MSLISDALRRARQDTGRLDSGPRLPGPLRPPSRRRSGLTVVLVAVLAAVVGAGAVWLVVRRSALAPVEDRAAMPRATVPITASGGERQSGAGAPVVGETPGGSTPQAAAPGVTGAAGPAPAGEAKRGERYEPETAQRSPGTGASVAEPSGGVAPGTGAAGQPVTGAPQTARAATESVAAGGSGDSRSMAPGHLEKLEGTLARPPGSG
ncbi:MAG TPA: hypothetical protein ENK19_02225, partial [Acidobacteria bacterium]|nr:hypothetical protein [Acidobacteriota bacterium]